MSLEAEIEIRAKAWAELLATDLKLSLDQALKDGGSKRPQHTLNFNDSVKIDKGNITIQILATDDYWVNIEDGRGKDKTPPPQKAIEKWIKETSISPQKVMAEIQLKYENSKKYSRLTKLGTRLSKPKKKLSYNEAAKALSYVFRAAIAKDGIEPKPFIDRVLTEDRLRVLTESIAEVTGKTMLAELNLNNEFKDVIIRI